jgi:hypothetical protein
MYKIEAKFTVKKAHRSARAPRTTWREWLDEEVEDEPAIDEQALNDRLAYEASVRSGMQMF